MDAVQVKKAVVFTVRTCYRSVYRHPFFVGMVIFLILLYRSFPFLFYFLVSASPIIVSTAVLLGTLLSFGHPNIPEIEKEETNHEISSLRTGVVVDDTVVERDGSYIVERYNENRSDVDKSIEELSAVADDFRDVSENDILDERAPLIQEHSREYQFEKWETHGESDSCDVVFGNMNEVRDGDGEPLVNLYSPIQQLDMRDVDESIKNAKSLEDYVGVETTDRMFPLGSPREHADDDDDYDVSDSESDGDESSSPDASMADIIPLLDELHPLLDEDAPQPAHMSAEGSDATSETSSESSSSEDYDNELDEDIEKHGNDLEVAHDEEEEEGHVDNGDEDKSAIRWTEDDQKNLMDLGTSEMERNKRLESLIARRRLRKSMKLMTEKNLIDFDSADLPFSLAHISTSRRNPFDLPYDDDMGLPPIPGSAPSVMFQRRNPFDLPYDSSEEKPDLMGDDFQQDVMTLQSKEPVFRRNETFNAGPSLFGTSRHDSKFKPYFIPERMSSEGTSYASFHRQSSDLSDSKASSVPEMESVTSNEDLEHKKLTEEDLLNETEMNSIGHPELSSIPEHPIEHAGHGSESSEDEDLLDLGQVKRDDVVDEFEVRLVEVEDYRDIVSSFSAASAAATSMELKASDVHMKTEALELQSRCSSSFSEVDEEIYAENEDEVLSTSDQLRGNSNEDSAIMHQLSTEKADIKITGQLGDTQFKEPVYDSTTAALDTNFYSSSVESDLHVERATTSSPPSLIPELILFTRNDSEVNNQGIVSNHHVVEVDEELVIAHHQPPLEEHMSNLEKGLPLSDQSVNEPSPRNLEELKESTNYLIELDFQELDNIHKDIDPPKTFESEFEEIEAPGGLNDNILDRVQNSEMIRALMHDSSLFEANTTTDSMENNVEDLGHMEEIDEELLLELDVVGDFSVNDSESNLNESSAETFHMLQDFGNSYEDLQGNDHSHKVTVEDEQNLGASRIEKELSEFEGKMEEASVFQISESNLGEHVNSSHKDISHMEAADLFNSENINDKTLLEATVTELDLNTLQTPKAEVYSGVPVVEVQAVHDNELSFKEAEPMLEEMNVRFGESENFYQDQLHVRSSDDIQSASGLVDASKSEKQYDEVSDSAKLLSDEAVDVFSQYEILHEGSVPYESKPDLTLLESNLINDEQSANELQQDPLYDTETEVVILAVDDIASSSDEISETVVDSQKQHAPDLVNAKLSPDETTDGYFQCEMVHEDLYPPESKSDLSFSESKIIQDSQSASVQQHGEPVKRLIPFGSNGDNLLDSAESKDPLETSSSVHVGEATRCMEDNAVSVHVSEAVIEKLPIANSEIESMEEMVNEVQSSKANESNSKVHGLVETDSEIVEKLPEEVETSEDTKRSVVEHKKADSRNSNTSSSSSSTSSSNSSDSDEE